MTILLWLISVCIVIFALILRTRIIDLLDHAIEYDNFILYTFTSIYFVSLGAIGLKGLWEISQSFALSSIAFATTIYYCVNYTLKSVSIKQYIKSKIKKFLADGEENG